MPDKKITLHPKSTDGQILEDTNIYPKTTIDQVYSSSGVEQFGDNTFQRKLTAGTAIEISNDTVGLGYETQAFKSILLNAIFPVGAVYVSETIGAENKCPIELSLGGTWERIQGRFLLGAGANYENTTDAYGSLSANVINRTTPGEKGGEVSHTLSSNETPIRNHRHDYTLNFWTGNYDNTSKIWVLGDDATDTHGNKQRLFGKAENANNYNPGEGFSLAKDGDVIKESRDYTTTGLPDVNLSTNGDCYGNQLCYRNFHSHHINVSDSTAYTSIEGVAHNNMPPYYVVYMWRRIA